MRILIIDDHTLFRVGLKDLLERRGIVVTAVGEGATGIEIARVEQPDVVLLDLRMPGMSGVEVLQTLRNSGFASPIVMLTTSGEKWDLVECLKSGAQGYLLKDMAPEALVAALDDIVAGKTVIAPDLAEVLANVVRAGSVEAAGSRSLFEALTPREMEILRHLAEGQSNKLIARCLGISDGTVKLHVKAILRKLDVSSRVEAAVLAVENGLGQRPAI